ncbi:MAG: hypothetical protein ACT6Q7_02905 [Blastomonas fulva]|uniref:hypothetical protein n=1 Tax=Blastomonas fulva TaxID=1550728 RepID=UPI0040337423
MHVLIEIQPLNLSSGAREAVRVASAQDRRITGLNGVVWAPAITVKPVLGIRLFDGDFSSTVEPGAATFTINLAEVAETYPNTYAYLWAGAPVSIYAETPGTAWPWTRRFVGKVSRFEKTAKRLQLVAEVDSAALDKDVLYLKYAGTTGLEGGADLKDRVRPWVWGHVKSIEPIQIDIDNSVFQVSGYGPVAEISAVFERGSSFGASQGDYPDFAGLVAATIPPGKWATCLAQGLFRLGAPPFGVITADVQGHLVAGAVPRRTGAIIKAMAAALSISGDSIDSASLDALDTAVPRNINVYLTEQTSFFDFAQQLCLPCNAYSGMSWGGKFFAVRPVFGSAALTLNGQGRADPPVLEMIEGGVNPPFKKTIMGADRCWRVHTTTEIAYQDILVDRGRYSASETYRAGNIVDLADGSRWVYINATATAGNTPADGSTYWERITPGTDVRDIGGQIISEGTFPTFADTGQGDFHIDMAGLRYIRSSDADAVITLDGAPVVLDGNPLTNLWRRTDPAVRLGGVGGLRLVNSIGNNMADVDIVNAFRRRLTAPFTVQINASSTGEVQTQLPLNIAVRAKQGNEDVSANTAFSAVFSASLVGTINNTPGDANRGTITLTGFSASGSIMVTGTFPDGLQDTIMIDVPRVTASQVAGGGAGSQSVVDFNWSNVTSFAFMQITDDPLLINSSPTGALKFEFYSAFTFSGSSIDHNIEVVARYRLVGAGSWTDVPSSQRAGEPAIIDPEFRTNIPGFVGSGGIITAATGANNTTHEVALFARRVTGGETITFASNDSIFRVTQ